MIEVERVNGQKIWINPNLIKFLEATPDTVVTMRDNEKLLLRTPLTELIQKIQKHHGGG
ncbi:MAG: flagellar FlbD family protein [Oligoflexia bacterium]|nr:flagellar FlbD family protein [Oligoflexia bacterium]